MTSTLRPMNLGEILDKTFQIYRAKFLMFVGIAALPALGMLALYAADIYWRSAYASKAEPLIFDLTLPGMVVTFAYYLGNGFFSLLVKPSFIDTTASIIHGKQTSVLSALSAIRIRWQSTLALNLAEQVIVVVPLGLISIGLVYSVGAVINSDSADVATTGIAYVVFLVVAATLVIYFVWIGSCISFSFPSLVIQGGSWPGSIKRAWKLSKGTRSRIILTWFLVLIVTRGLSWLARWALYFALVALPVSRLLLHGRLDYGFIYAMASATVYALAGPIYPIAITLFYYDQRIRLEGYDIECMMKAAGLDGVAVKVKNGSFDSLRSAFVAQDNLMNGEGQV